MEFKFRDLCVLIVAIICWFAAAQADNTDQITSLPGLKHKITFNQYAGYLTVDPASGRKLFYWFVESQNSPSTDPVVLWMNGGPGCSSLIGFLTEHGPFRPDPKDNGTSLVENPHSWNLVANVMYLEAPAGVGFSYSNNTNDYNTGDQQTAADNYQALLQFFLRYPQFKGNKFFVAGESFGGHYVPQLADAVLTGNQAGNQAINLQGILVGNGLTVDAIDLNTVVPTWAYHMLFPFPELAAATQACDGNFLTNQAPACQDALNQINNDIGNIDPYDMYAPVCNSNSGYRPVRFAHPALERLQKQASKQKDLGLEFDACVDTHITNYLNQEDVRKAIHADDAAGAWSECSNKINYNFTVGTNDLRPLYQKFFDTANISILIFTGDVDSVVPSLGTEQWIASMNRPVVKNWTSWNTKGGQIGGFVTVYDKLTFLTIRGAGHMVAYFQPALAFDFFSTWMQQHM
eukprot:TRINITY_DN4614_c0_g1_i1.p1 TRINITY_DN4614_c0_g1~~TRINITY_DN4614_c0_g1_i1.p1  ORF type:complete len:496 (-),score=62.01 TRINITY_DN4614_c0_g1_i1:61-1443(-)